MPLYDYSCTSCLARFDDIQLTIADRNTPCDEPCPACQRVATIERVLSAPHIGDAMRQGRTNLPSSWTDKLAHVKSQHIRSTIKVPAPAKREV